MQEIFREAILLESSGDYVNAMYLYDLLIEQYEGKTLKEKRLVKEVTQRLKELKKQIYLIECSRERMNMILLID